MKLFFDFFPIIVFFIAFKFFGIYIATSAAIIVSFLQVGLHWIKHRSFETMQIISLAIIAVFGGSTLLLHNEMFIKWKPTVLNWALALLFLGSQWLAEKPFIQRLMGSSVSMPTAIWNRLNLAWVLFFVTMGAINLFVVYHFSTSAWVNFKLFGMLGITFLFAILQAIYLSKHLETLEKSP